VSAHFRAQILDQETNYVLVLKENQETVYQDMMDGFGDLAQDSQDSQVRTVSDVQRGKVHGRVEQRIATVHKDERP